MGPGYWQLPPSRLFGEVLPCVRANVPAPRPRPALLEKTGLAQTICHVLAGNCVGVAVQIPAGRFCAAARQGAYIGQCVLGLFVAAELSTARNQDEGAVRVRPDAASC